MVRKLKALLLTRLLLGLFFLALTGLVQLRREWNFLSVHLQPLYFLAMVIFLFTIVAAVSLKHIRNLKTFAYLQHLFDVGAVTVLIFLSGGVHSFYSFLYMPVIISAALLLHRQGSLWVASCCSLSYGLLLDLQYFGWITPLQMAEQKGPTGDIAFYFYSLSMNIVGFYLVAYLSGHLAAELQKSSRQVQEQKRDLRVLESLHKNIVESINSGLLTVDLAGHVVFSNPASQEILGLSAQQLMHRRVAEIFPALDSQPSSCLPPPNGHNAAAPSGRKEVLYCSEDGRELCLGYTTSILHDDDGEPSGWIFVFQDLTLWKEMEQRVKLSERLAFAGNIAAEIAHEIRNPLASISGAVELVQGTLEEDPRQGRLFNIIQREIRRIDELITDFMWLAKGAAKSEKIEEVAVVDGIEETLSLLKVRRKINAAHEVVRRFEAHPKVLIDANSFRQILWNLFINALEAMPDGGVLSVRVAETAQTNDSAPAVRIDVADTGAGIREDIREKISEPFFTTKKNGAGLGLSIVHQLVESSGGRLEITAHRGPGATFTIFFPIPRSFPLAN